MDPSAEPSFATRPFHFLMLKCSGLGLVLLFAVWTLIGALPPRLIDPIWSHQLAAGLINHAPLLVTGLVMIRLADLLEPEPDALYRWAVRISRLTTLLAVVYLLVIPLEISSAWRQSDAVVERRQEQLWAMNRSYTRILNIINTASDPRRLASDLRAVEGPRLTPADQQRPLADLQQELRRAMQRTRADLSSRINRQNPTTLPAMIREAFRIGLSGLIVSTCLFSLSWNPTTNQSLLERWILGFQDSSLRRQARRRQRLLEEDERTRERRKLALADPGAAGPDPQSTPPPSIGRRRRALDVEADDYVRQIMPEDDGQGPTPG